MKVPRVISLGMAVPGPGFTQDQAYDFLGWKRGVTRRIFEHAGIERRYSYVPPQRFAEVPSWQELCDWYQSGAISLGLESAKDALDGGETGDIGLITFASVSGYTCPSLSYPIAAKLGLRSDVVHSDLLGMGCEAAAPSLERAFDYVRTHPTKRALSLAVEICSATWYPAKENDLEYVVSSAIFGDAASAAVLGYSGDTRFPQVVDFESYYSPEYIDLLGYRWENGYLKVVLSRDVPEIVPPLMAQTVDRLLERNLLTRGDVSHWMLHPGGRTVLENIEKVMGLDRQQTRQSWEALRRFGNVSSATVGIIAKLTQQESPQGWGVAATMGAGTAVNAVLVKWG